MMVDYIGKATFPRGMARHVDSVEGFITTGRHLARVFVVNCLAEVGHVVPE